MALPAGVAPASVRLEDGCFVWFGHGSAKGVAGSQVIKLQGVDRSEFATRPACDFQPDNFQPNKWSARQELHLRSLGPKPRMLLLHHALETPEAPTRASGVMGNTEHRTLAQCSAARIEKWRTRRGLHPQPSRRQRGALLIELRVRELVGSAGPRFATANS